MNEEFMISLVVQLRLSINDDVRDGCCLNRHLGLLLDSSRLEHPDILHDLTDNVPWAPFYTFSPFSQQNFIVYLEYISS